MFGVGLLFESTGFVFERAVPLAAAFNLALLARPQRGMRGTTPGETTGKLIKH
jgi:hypothetical protein